MNPFRFITDMNHGPNTAMKTNSRPIPCISRLLAIVAARSDCGLPARSGSGRRRGSTVPTRLVESTRCGLQVRRPIQQLRAALRPIRLSRSTLATVLLAACLDAGAPSTARAQAYTVDWSSLDAGGGFSAGGGFAITSTVGQPDMGAASNDAFSINGGFWSIFVPPPFRPPFLSVTRQGASIRVSWPRASAGFTLDQSSAVTGSWSQVALPYITNATEISVLIASPGSNRFYRLRRP